MVKRGGLWRRWAISSLNAGAILKAYGSLLRRPAFMVPAMAGGIEQSSMFAYITGSPFVFMGRYGFSEHHYSWVFGFTAVGLIVGAQINRMALRALKVTTLLGFALVFNLVANLVLVAVAHAEQPFLLMAPLWFAIASLGLISGNAAAVAMSASDHHAGTASGLFGVLQFSCAFAVSSAVATLQNGTAYPMTRAMLTVSLVGCSLWFAGSRWRQREA